MVLKLILLTNYSKFVLINLKQKKMKKIILMGTLAASAMLFSCGEPQNAEETKVTLEEITASEDENEAIQEEINALNEDIEGLEAELEGL